MKLTQANTAIVLDSTSDFPEAAERFANVRVVPLYVRFGDDTYRDRIDIDPHEFYKRLRVAKVLPTTSQPTPQDFLDTYEQLAGYERIYSMHLSAKLSGTYQSAALAAAEAAGDRVVVVDTGSASAAIGMLALALQRRLQRGAQDDEVDALVDRFRRRSRVVFTVDTLEFLQKGGRIGRGQALAGTLLNVKPILQISEGEVVPVGRVRGRQKALQEFGRIFTADTVNTAGLRAAIAHADSEAWVDVIKDLVRRARPLAEIEIVATLGAVVGTHAGPGCVGFFWFQDDE
jgi:DegV family protein with EDD domain